MLALGLEEPRTKQRQTVGPPPDRRGRPLRPMEADIFLSLCVWMRSGCKQLIFPIAISGARRVATPERGGGKRGASRSFGRNLGLP